MNFFIFCETAMFPEGGSRARPYEKKNLSLPARVRAYIDTACYGTWRI